ncbi:SulP family inorganic anion transporter [Demequina sp. TTPB684]|uniref:SulP family inorganic anion transporter n=1 Tax=unclassified Demequina TaxID=2620311 RepID=UPI001CF45E90|nr:MULTISPECIES: SulP family inorganic anion transporter [unclassified Demequina]MCB2413382.1 SulP family inorganic anion transporter [Demequina sp. TTPB684]UPU87395.1 SulP family inorganic anion transporter [Demequina sp. TMPB413]
MSATRLRTLLPGRSDYAQLRTTWKGDVIAGVTVGIVALPLALAFGVTSGAGAAAGLVTAIVAGLVAGVFGGSNIQVSGPTGAMVVVLAPIITAHGVGALAVVSALAGVFVLVAGVLKLGRAVAAIPWPVIEGFTLGIAIIIFLQQVPGALGVTSTHHGANAVIEAGNAIADASGGSAVWSLGIVAGVAAVTLGFSVWAPRIPGSILAVVGATIVAAVAHAPVALIGALPAGLPAPSVPHVSLELASQLIVPAATVAALAAIESLLSARVASAHSNTGPYDADRELVGQGLASVASGFFGGMPATGAIARTAVNVRSGGRTRLAAIVHAVALLLIVSVGATVVDNIPLAALAGVLMVTAVRMVPRRTITAVFRSSRSSALLFVITAVVTVSVDLIYAVGVGLVAAAFFALRALAATAGVHREELPAPGMPGDESIAVFRIDGALFFAAAERVQERVMAIDGVSVVILRLSQLQLLDATGAQVLVEIVEALEARGVTVLIKGVQERHLAQVTRAGVIEALRHHHHLFDHLYEAIEHARSHVERGEAADEIAPASPMRA